MICRYCGKDNKVITMSTKTLEVLQLLDQGKSDPEIAALMGLAHRTVKFYIKKGMLYYGVKNRIQLAVAHYQTKELERMNKLDKGELSCDQISS